MEIRTLVKKGEEHLTYCEDFSFYRVLEDDTIIAAVFDGCSDGITSHFASALLGKILKKCVSSYTAIKEEYIHVAMISIIYELFKETKFLRDRLNLVDLEIISTFIFMIVKGNKVYIISSGDGVIKIGDDLIILESPNNEPDYMAYHLDSQFVDFYDTHLKEYSGTFTSSISISTDGILSFRNTEKGDVSSEVIDFLLNDTNLLGSEAMLSRKYNILRKKGYVNFDDVCVIRVINTDSQKDESI